MSGFKRFSRYPRLSAALALTGLFAASGGTASAMPVCQTDYDELGDFRMQTTLYYPRSDDVSVHFKTHFVRLMPNELSDYIHVINDEQLNVIHKSSVDFDLTYEFMHERGVFETELTNFSVYFVSVLSSDYNSRITGSGIRIRDAAHEPIRTIRNAGSGMSKTDYAESVGMDVFQAWATGRSVTIDFFHGRDDDQTALGSVVLKPDEIGQFHETLDDQFDRLVGLSNAGECRPASQPFDDDDCFLTTATVRCIGLADDCWELQSLRAFRDSYLMETEQGRALVSEYYDIAPAIVDAVNRRSDGQWQWLKTYWTGILPTALLVKSGFHGLAQQSYYRMVRNLQALV